MLAVDTNVIARLILGDDANQSRRAVDLFQFNSVWIAKTVLLELDWVLRKSYGYDRHRVFQAIGEICGLSNVTVEDTETVGQALAWMTDGLDFADAMHLASRGDSTAFSTFDKPLQKAARRLGLKVQEPK